MYRRRWAADRRRREPSVRTASALDRALAQVRIITTRYSHRSNNVRRQGAKPFYRRYQYNFLHREVSPTQARKALFLSTSRYHTRALAPIRSTHTDPFQAETAATVPSNPRRMGIGRWFAVSYHRPHYPGHFITATIVQDVPQKRHGPNVPERLEHQRRNDFPRTHELVVLTATASCCECTQSCGYTSGSEYLDTCYCGGTSPRPDLFSMSVKAG